MVLRLAFVRGELMGGKLYCNDCGIILKELVSNNVTVDAIIADIPYNIGYDSWDNGFDLSLYINDLYTILEDGGNVIIFSGYSNVCEIKSILDSKFDFRNWIIYDRVKGRGATKNLVSTREDILWYSKGENYTFNKLFSNVRKVTGGMGQKNGEPNRALSNVWSDISPIVPWSKERCNHPTQKPLELMSRCIRLWTNEGDTILDFTMGSGSTGVACKILKRNFIGIEKSSKYYNLAITRMKYGQ